MRDNETLTMLKPVESIAITTIAIALSCIAWIYGPLSDIRGYDPFAPFLEIIAFGICVWTCWKSRGVGMLWALLATVVTGLLALLGIIGVIVVLTR